MKKLWIAVLVIGLILTGRFSLLTFASNLSFELLGDNPLHVEATTNFIEPGVKITLNKKDVSDKVSIKGEVDTSKTGTYEITYTYSYLMKTYSKKREVIVEDTVGPTIELTDGTEVTASSIDLYEEPGYKATDAVDGDCTDSVKITQTEKKDRVIITYTATDSLGNQSEATRTVLLKDVVKPTIELLGDEHITLKKGESFEEPGVKAVDDLDGDISAFVKSSGYIDMFAAGDYEITYTAKDNAGNEASVKRTVTVSKAAVTNPVYLTFDDGPSTTVTPQILKTLKANDINATFFIVNYDNNKEKLKVLKTMIKNGNTLGIHAYSHDWSAAYSKDNAYVDGLDKMSSMIWNDLQYVPFAVRFPGGSNNSVSKRYNTGVMTRLIQSVPEAGYTYYDWNVYDGDSDGPVASVSKIVNNVTKNLKKGRNNIVLMHDISTKQTTADALSQIITWGKKHGYTFYPITQQTRPVQFSKLLN
jgi:peptidoglycan/xylan/chitin deacetylase (PgdA/CDA1 family)